MSTTLERMVQRARGPLSSLEPLSRPRFAPARLGQQAPSGVAAGIAGAAPEPAGAVPGLDLPAAVGPRPGGARFPRSRHGAGSAAGDAAAWLDEPGIQAADGFTDRSRLPVPARPEHDGSEPAQGAPARPAQRPGAASHRAGPWEPETLPGITHATAPAGLRPPALPALDTGRFTEVTPATAAARPGLAAPAPDTGLVTGTPALTVAGPQTISEVTPARSRPPALPAPDTGRFPETPEQTAAGPEVAPPAVPAPVRARLLASPATDHPDGVSPGPPARQRPPGDAAGSRPDIKISIGHIEVRAAPASDPPPTRAPFRPRVSLADFLGQQERGT